MLAARLIDAEDYVGLQSTIPAIAAARALERGDASATAVNWSVLLGELSERLHEHGDEVGALEALRLIGLALVWRGRQLAGKRGCSQERARASLVSESS